MNTTHHGFGERLAKARNSLKFAVTRAILDFTEQVVGRMTSIGMNKAQLADRLNTSPAYVTKMLRGETNFTLETMVKVLRCLESELEIRVCPKNRTSQWFPSESVIVVDTQYADEEFQAFFPERWAQAAKPSEFTHHARLTNEIISTTNR